MQPTSADAGRPSAIVTAIVVAAAVLLWIAVTVELLFLVPGYERVFADFQMRVPLLTEWVIAASRWSRLYFYVLAIAIGPMAVGIAFSTWWIRHRRHRMLAALWCFVMLLVPAAVAAVIWLACYWPFQLLVDALGPPNG